MNTPKIALTLLAALAVAGETRAENVRGVTIDFSDIGNPNNASDTTSIKTTGAGDVSYPYAIGKYEITAKQWTDFLNIVDPTGANALGLFSLNMENNSAGMQINNNGTVNGSRYAVTTGSDKPLVHAKWHMAARFCNYLTTGNTETGPYIIGSGTSMWAVDRAAAQANWQKIYVLPTLDEWYKAAYHKGAGLAGTDYWDFPIQADVISQSMANYGSLAPTDAESYPYPSGYGTYDQGGNVREWLETPYDATRYMYRGGSWDRIVDAELKSSGVGYQVPNGSGSNLGFRIVRLAATAGFVLPTPVHQSAFVNASVSAFSPLPAFCTPLSDPQTGYTLARLGGRQAEMTSAVAMPPGATWDSDHAKHWYSSMPAVNCNDTLAVSNARKGVAAIWDVQTLKLLGWGPAVGSTTYPETTNTQRGVVWDKLNPLKYYFCTQNRIMACTITRQAGPPASITTNVQQVYQFPGYDLISFGDTKGDISRDNIRTTLVGKKIGVTNAVTVIAFNLDSLTIQGTRDITDVWNTANKPNRWEDFDGAMVDPTGQYVVYDSGANGIFSLPWSGIANPQTPWIHVTSAQRHGELVVDANGVPHSVRNSNQNGIMKHILSAPNDAGVQVWSVGGSDGHMSAVDQWPGKFIFSRYLDGGIYLFDLANPGYSYYLGNSRHYKVPPAAGQPPTGIPASYGQQPKASISAAGRTIMFISDNGSSTSSAACVYALQLPQ